MLSVDCHCFTVVIIFIYLVIVTNSVAIAHVFFKFKLYFDEFYRCQYVLDGEACFESSSS